MAKPFTFNIAALSIVPISAVQARTAADQIDAIWEVADDPSTPKDRAMALIRLVNKMSAKVKKTG